jgi:2-polyprenyl-3-methyl-5-hydroxy-6-metoxy-1,4-benzoquinol methylase
MIHNCDLCQSPDAIEVPHAREYTGNQPIHICCGCGFVFVRERRSAREIADSWSGLYDGTYTPSNPAVIARLTYVAETIRQQVGLEGKSLCDIGAGDGTFLQIAKQMGAQPFGIEPSTAHAAMEVLSIAHFAGTVEEAKASVPRFDIVTVLWTLENCGSCIDMLKAARQMLKLDGRLVVATGSRILVPWKKPLHCYLGKNPADTHAFRFSVNALRRAFYSAGFLPMYLNSYIDNDVLLMIGVPVDNPAFMGLTDNPQAVTDFFWRWHEQWP